MYVSVICACVFVSESRASGASGGGASVRPSRAAHGAASTQGRLLQVQAVSLLRVLIQVAQGSNLVCVNTKVWVWPPVPSVYQCKWNLYLCV